jgi:Domain of unknown function (DUF4112)
MYTNLVIDFVVGLVPIIGDLADAWFKCNTRNNILLEQFLRERGLKNPVAPPPPATKQSTFHKLFGDGPNAPGNHPEEPVVHETKAATTASHPSVAVEGGLPELPPRHAPPERNGFRTTVSGHGEEISGTQEDLEAQDEDVIHYRRQ